MMDLFEQLLITCINIGDESFTGDIVIPSDHSSIKLAEDRRELLYITIELVQSKTTSFQNTELGHYRKIALQAIRAISIRITTVPTESMVPVFEKILVAITNAGKEWFDGDLVVPSALAGLDLNESRFKILKSVLMLSKSKVDGFKKSDLRKYREPMLQSVQVALDLYEHNTGIIPQLVPTITAALRSTSAKRAADTSSDVQPAKRAKTLKLKAPAVRSARSPDTLNNQTDAPALSVLDKENDEEDQHKLTEEQKATVKALYQQFRDLRNALGCLAGTPSQKGRRTKLHLGTKDT